VQITYIGHATLLIRIGPHTILTDPNFDPALGGILKRVAPPGIPLDELPELDAVLLSHAHADHLSFDSLGRLPSSTPVVAPPRVADWLSRRGYSQVVALAPGNDMVFGDLIIHASEATHVGSRYGIDRWRADANMYLIQLGLQSCFFAGDTALTPGTHKLVADEIHARDRQLDVALLPIGHAPRWKVNFRRGHLTTDDALELFERLDARYFIPYHWGTFNHVTSSAFDAIDRLRVSLASHPRGEHVIVLEPGASFDADSGRGEGPVVEVTAVENRED
jgi:L-ascorbate metabolism protein UlaG (beta-lactamase superfamily)